VLEEISNLQWSVYLHEEEDFCFLHLTVTAEASVNTCWWR